MKLWEKNYEVKNEKVGKLEVYARTINLSVPDKVVYYTGKEQTGFDEVTFGHALANQPDKLSPVRWPEPGSSGLRCS